MPQSAHQGAASRRSQPDGMRRDQSEVAATHKDVLAVECLYMICDMTTILQLSFDHSHTQNKWQCLTASGVNSLRVGQYPAATPPSTKGQFLTSVDAIFTHNPSYQTAFNLFFQLARLQLLSESMPSNWQLASCALEQLAGIWGFPPHPTHLRPLSADAIKDCSRLFPHGSDEKVGGGRRAYRTVDAVNATQPSSIASINHLTHSGLLGRGKFVWGLRSD